MNDVFVDRKILSIKVGSKIAHNVIKLTNSKDIYLGIFFC